MTGKVIVTSTMHAYVTDQADTSLAWLYTAKELRYAAAAVGVEVEFFAALETDARGLAPFAEVLDRLAELSGQHWTFSFDDGATEISTANRLRRITQGQNLASMFTLDAGGSHMLFLAADTCPPSETIPKLLELDWPYVGGEVPTYCLHGETVLYHPQTGAPYPFPVEHHMPTAAFVMLDRDMLKRTHWRYDTEKGMTDDPCLFADAQRLGIPALVRKDVLGRHYPETIGPIESRGHDMRIRKAPAQAPAPPWPEPAPIAERRKPPLPPKPPTRSVVSR